MYYTYTFVYFSLLTNFLHSIISASSVRPINSNIDENTSETPQALAKQSSNSPKSLEIVNGTSKLKKSRKNRTKNCLQIQPSFHVNELVWAKMRGFPYWPGVIENVTSKGQYNVHFFGDYTRSHISRNNIVHFLDGFEQYSSHTGNAKLLKAIKEARIFLLSEGALNECLVCKIPKIKAIYREQNKS